MSAPTRVARSASSASPTSPAARSSRRSLPAASPRASLTAPRTRPRPPVRAPAPRSTPRGAPKTTTRTAPKTSPRRTPPSRSAPRLGARRRFGVFVVLGISVILTIVAFHAVLAQNQVALDRTRARIVVAEDRYENERLENGVLASPARITQRAAELGMAAPNVAPIAVPLAGEVPKRGSSTSALADWSEVKRHLDSSP